MIKPMSTIASETDLPLELLVAAVEDVNARWQLIAGSVLLQTHGSNVLTKIVFDLVGTETWNLIRGSTSSCKSVDFTVD